LTAFSGLFWNNYLMVERVRDVTLAFILLLMETAEVKERRSTDIRSVKNRQKRIHPTALEKTERKIMY
jgi:hypothetical protein